MSTTIAGSGAILLTGRRPEPLRALLQDLGLQVRWVPLLAVEATGWPPPAGRPDVAVLTSAAAVDAVPDIAHILVGTRLGAVGAHTAAALIACGLAPDVTGTSGGVAVLDALAPLPTEQLWHIGAERIAAPVQDWLDRRVGPTQRWVVYRTARPATLARPDLLDGVGCVVCTSPAVVESLATLGPPAAGVRWVAIGPTTADAMRRCGFEPVAVAATPTPTSLVEAVCAAIKRPSGASGPW